VKETRVILANILRQRLIPPKTQQELLKWYDIITKQNYFTHKELIVVQHNGLAMGARHSGLIAEIFLQHIEHSQLTRLPHKHKIINYCRYVDDILIFDSNHCNIQKIFDYFNSLHPKLLFTAETEKDLTLNFLDISLHRTPTNMRTATFRKPTFTDTIIPFTSNHPTHRKYATVKFLYNRLDTYNLQQEEYLQELYVIHNILHISFPIKPHNPPHPQPSETGSPPARHKNGEPSRT